MLQDHVWNAHCSSSLFAMLPGAVCFSNMVLEHIQLRIFLKIISGPGPIHKTVSRGQNLTKTFLHACIFFT